jgi:hypothetical protein
MVSAEFGFCPSGIIHKFHREASLQRTNRSNTKKQLFKLNRKNEQPPTFTYDTPKTKKAQKRLALEPCVPFDCCGTFKRRTVCTLLSAICRRNRTRCRMLRLAAMHSSSFARAANGSHLTHLLNSFSVPTNGRASLIASSYGAAGGTAGLLVQYLVEGHNCSIPDSES